MPAARTRGSKQRAEKVGYSCYRLTRLAKRDHQRLGIGAGPALEGPLVVVNLLGRLYQRE